VRIFSPGLLFHSKQIFSVPVLNLLGDVSSLVRDAREKSNVSISRADSIAIELLATIVAAAAAAAAAGVIDVRLIDADN